MEDLLFVSSLFSLLLLSTFFLLQKTIEKRSASGLNQMLKLKSRAREWRAAVLLSLAFVTAIESIAMMVALLPFTCVAGESPPSSQLPRRILVDTDVDTDDIFALLYLLKLNKSQFDLTAVTISGNAWSNGGHAVNHVYDLLFMMGRDDISIGVGGEGGILENSTILPDVGGYLPLIEQEMTTSGYCRYRQSIPVGKGGRLDADTNYGLHRGFLPRGRRHYVPIWQPTTQQVMIDTISAGPTTVLLLGSHTNFAIFLMSNPQLKNNVDHIYTMGGSVTRESNDGNICSSGEEEYCGHVGNVFTAYTSNPYAEFNLFQDPFAAYQVIHSGIPVTLVPLDATDTIPITESFLQELQRRQSTYEAQYIYKTLKMTRDTWSDNHFFQRFYMWDSFTAGIVTSPASSNGDNQFSVMEYMNITVVTSNKPYGISDGSNPFFFDRHHKVPKFGLKNCGVHSGHVQTGLRDPFCYAENGKGRCQDGRTRILETTDAGTVARVLVARKAKPTRKLHSTFNTEFAKVFLDVINRPQQSGRFNITSQFPSHKQIFYPPELQSRKLGKPVIFDMDMSVGDFLALIYLLKVPTEVINLQAIFVTPTGWATAATIDIVYDVLHMMGRDDIPVGLGNFFAINQSYEQISSTVGDCKYAKAIPHGSGGLLDSDTLYGLGRTLPRSPRRYTAEDSVKYGAPRDTEHPELRQPLALEIWKNLTTNNQETKITILTNGPLTTLASIITSDRDTASHIQEVFVVGGHIKSNANDTGNVFTIPSNNYAEFNMFLDPVAAQILLNTQVNITLIPLGVQRKVTSFKKMLLKLKKGRKTPEVIFATHLVSQLRRLQRTHFRYQHMGIFMGEILGAPTLVSDMIDPLDLLLNSVTKPVGLRARGDDSIDGNLEIDQQNGRWIRVLLGLEPAAYYDLFAERLKDKKQSAVLKPVYNI